jgi:hypothetical protein
MTTDILPFYTHEEAWHDEELPDLHKYAAIGVESYEQMNFLRCDPEPFKQFEHVIAENENAHMWQEIRNSLIAFGLLGLLIYWGFGL